MLSNVNIVDIISRYISVEKKGQSYQALCPFHDDRNPSLMISPTKGVFKCFVCNTGGNAIRFVQLYEKKSYFEAARKVAETINFKSEFFAKPIMVSKTDNQLAPLVRAINDLTAYYEYTLLTPEGVAAKEYLQKRGLNDTYIKKYRIGYAPQDGQATILFLQNKGHTLKTLQDIGVLSGDLDRPYDKNQSRIIFPLTNTEGQIVGFSARTMSREKDVPKYVNSPETKLFIKSNTLYNYHYAKDLMAIQYLYVVEGFLDVIALDRAGIKSAVALMGTAFTHEQVTLLKRLNKEIRIWLDSDIPGQMATLSVVKDLMAADIKFQIIKPNEERLDPDDYLKKHGEEALQKLSTTFISREDYIFNYYMATNKRDDIEANKKFVNDVMDDVIVKLNSRLEVSAFIDRLSEASGFNGVVLHKMYESKLKSIENKDRAQRIVETRLPLKQVLNKVTQAERYILYQMIVYPEARAFFDEKVKIFTHEIHRYIANYLKEYASSETFNYAMLLNDVNTRFADEHKISEYTNELLDIEQDLDKVKYDEAILNDSLKILLYERELKLLEKEHENALLKASDDELFLAEKKRFLEKKQKLIKKYERK